MRWLFALSHILVFATWAWAAPAAEIVRTWDFDGDATNRLPAHFVLGTFFDGRPAGDWKVTETPKALSPPNVFAQLRNKGAEHNYNVVLVEDTNVADLDLS